MTVGWVKFRVVRVVQVLKQLLDTMLGRGVPFDLSLPAAGGGVFDELLFDR